MIQAITINETDNLAVALTDLKAGTDVTVNDIQVKLVNNIPAKHKFALYDFDKGASLTMYGLVVGTANQPIGKGEAITTANVTHMTSGYDLNKQTKYEWQAPDASRFQDRTFMGYHRSDGQVGTDNIWLVFPLVFCENRNVNVLKSAFEKALGYEDNNPYENMVSSLVNHYQQNSLDTALDTVTLESVQPKTNQGVFENVKIRFITHQAGCGGTRQDSESLCRLFAGYVNNPNVAGATVLSLGCQN
ncbi:MAG: UxaA family hydrolase, partial [Cyclobacteriaceae bacterium]